MTSHIYHTIIIMYFTRTTPDTFSITNNGCSIGCTSVTDDNISELVNTVIDKYFQDHTVIFNPSVNEVFEPSMDEHIETVNEWTLVVHTVDDDDSNAYLFFETPTRREVFYNEYMTLAAKPESNAIHIWNHYDNRNYKYNLALHYKENIKKYTAYLKQAATAGHLEAAYLLADYHDDHGDRRSALYWYSFAAKRGHGDAMVFIAYCVDYGTDGYTKDQKRAFDMYMSAAERGSTLAAYNVAMSYKLGTGVEKNMKAFRYWICFAIQSGCRYAPYEMASHYYNRKKFKKCLTYCELSYNRLTSSNAKDDEIVQTCMLRAMCLAEMDSDINKDKIIEDLSYCVETEPNNAKAHYLIAEAYRSIDKEKAFTHMKTSADLDYHDAKWTLGYMYQQGDGCDKNYDIAFQLFTACLATKPKDIDALYSHGQCYEFGYGTEKNYDVAMSFYKKAASYGCVFSKERLAEDDDTDVDMRYNDVTKEVLMFQTKSEFPHFTRYRTYDITSLSLHDTTLYIGNTYYEYTSASRARNAFKTIKSYVEQYTSYKNSIIYETDNMYFRFPYNASSITSIETDCDDDVYCVTLKYGVFVEDVCDVICPCKKDVHKFITFLKDLMYK